MFSDRNQLEQIQAVHNVLDLAYHKGFWLGEADSLAALDNGQKRNPEAAPFSCRNDNAAAFEYAERLVVFPKMTAPAPQRCCQLFSGNEDVGSGK